MVAAMNEAGVDKSAIVHSSTTYGYDNSYMCDCIATQPKRFTGVGAVDLAAPDASEKIRYWHGKGVTGLRIFSAGSTFEKQADTLDDPATFKAWETCIETQNSGCHAGAPRRPAHAPQPDPPISQRRRSSSTT